MIVLGIALLILCLLAVIGLRANQTDWGSRWTNIIDGWFRIFCRRVHRFRYDIPPLPDSGAALLVSNHVSGLDPFLMIAATRRPLRFIIAREQYDRFGLNWLFRASGCIPVDRVRHPQQAFREALVRLREGEVVALFPGGHIHKPGEPAPRLKRGVVRLADLSGAQVYPVRIGGVSGRGHVVRSVFLPSRSHLKAFNPVDCAAAGEHNCLTALAEILNKPEDGSTTEETPT